MQRNNKIHFPSFWMEFYINEANCWAGIMDGYHPRENNKKKQILPLACAASMVCWYFCFVYFAEYEPYSNVRRMVFFYSVA